jgi:hypothetical protein
MLRNNILMKIESRRGSGTYNERGQSRRGAAEGQYATSPKMIRHHTISWHLTSLSLLLAASVALLYALSRA